MFTQPDKKKKRTKTSTRGTVPIQSGSVHVTGHDPVVTQTHMQREEDETWDDDDEVATNHFSSFISSDLFYLTNNTQVWTLRPTFTFRSTCEEGRTRQLSVCRKLDCETAQKWGSGV